MPRLAPVARALLWAGWVASGMVAGAALAAVEPVPSSGPTPATTAPAAAAPSPATRLAPSALSASPVAPALPPLSTELPAELRQALAAAKLPASALSLWVQAVDAVQPRLAWGAQQPLNPASLFKLATTLAGLELLGPAYSWRTPVWLGGPLRQGVLDGPLLIQGQGDPKLTPERLAQLVQRLRQSGVREIRGDVVLDRSAFARAEGTPADFDGEPLKPYNVAADALLLAQRSLVYTFTPDPARRVAVVTVTPELAGLQLQAEVPLASGPCDDWRAALAATPADPAQMRFAGRYPASCGERSWPLAYAEPSSFDARLLRALWQAAGGTLQGTVREGAAPTTPPSFVLNSPPLAEVVRDINKFSNNPMAQQLFLTLGLAQRGAGTPEAARAVLQQWLQQALAEAGQPEAAQGLVVDNGSGLSRQTRISAQALGLVLLRGWRGPQMPEWLASLPVAGLDGTARRSRGAPGRAHLKTGSLSGVAAVAGFVHAAGGRRWAVVAVLQHPNADNARAVLDAAVQWVGLLDSPPPTDPSPGNLPGKPSLETSR